MMVDMPCHLWREMHIYSMSEQYISQLRAIENALETVFLMFQDLVHIDWKSEKEM